MTNEVMWLFSDPLAALSNPHPERIIQAPTVKRARIGPAGALAQQPIQLVQPDVQFPQTVNVVPMAHMAPTTPMVPMAPQAIPMNYMMPGQVGWGLPGRSHTNLNMGVAQPNVAQRIPHGDVPVAMQRFGASKGRKQQENKGGW